MHRVKCYYCGQMFDRDKEECVKIENTNRYAHKQCSINSVPVERREQLELEEYVKKLFKMDYVHPNIQKQITEYVGHLGFSYSGIYRTLFYYFEILNNRPTLSNPTIGIVPYVYPQAREYYYTLYMAQKLNQEQKDKIKAPNEVTIVIKSPQREPMKKRNLFTFLDEENTDEE